MHIDWTGRLLAAALAVALPAGAATAGPCGDGVCFGAVAIGAPGIAGRASGQRTAPDAWDRADRACGGNCTRIEVFHSGCGAIAGGPDGQSGAGFATTRAAAEDEAIRECRAYGSEACFLRVWACAQ